MKILGIQLDAVGPAEAIIGLLAIAGLCLAYYSISGKLQTRNKYGCMVLAIIIPIVLVVALLLFVGSSLSSEVRNQSSSNVNPQSGLLWNTKPN